MKKILQFTAIVVLLVSCSSSETENGKSFTVTGTIKNRQAAKIWLQEFSVSTGQQFLRDSSAIAADGSFKLKTTSAEEAIYNLILSGDPNPVITLINDVPAVKVNADFSQPNDFYTVSGSEASSAVKDYLAKLGEMQREKYNKERMLDSLRTMPGSEQVSAEVDNQRKQLVANLKNFTGEAVAKTQSPAFALFVIATYQGMSNNPNFRMEPYDSEGLLGLFESLVVKFPARADIAGIRNTVSSQIVRPLWIGKEAPEIEMPDTKGKNVKLSSLRGKYVLVDFWASWCGPCRMENPNVVEAFHKYKNKNFTILGVSLDAKKDAWEKAIADDKLAWQHISDLKRWESSVVPLYKISGIPFNVLLNPEGKVIAENLRGSALEQKLAETLQ
jgi:peroxiredoxin